MPGDTAPFIITRSPHLHASEERGVSRANHAPSAMAIDAEREQAVKDALDTVSYALHFFRDYDEPNEIFSSRLVAYIRELLAPSLKEGVV